ncbi:MAG: alpha/beta hydrolase [Firmicutes bacterium]|nr:alpha/beta hydrolase [Bacillota bacterium]
MVNEMIECIKDCNINYIQYGNKKGKEIVLLHGWGQNIEMMKPIGDGLCDKYHITIIDLPGFGKSDEPKESFSLYDYYECVKELLTRLNVKNPTMVGHSFGGRISIIYSALEQTEKLVLLSSPFIKRIKKQSIKTKMLKILKKIPGLNALEEFAKSHIGSIDYRNATPIMRDTLVKTVNQDLTDYVKKINASTILIAGEFDTAVPLDEMKQYENYIEDSALIIYPGCTHYAYLEDANRTIAIIRNFI